MKKKKVKMINNYAITLAGGGMKGSFQIGVVKRLIEKFGQPEMISGCSVGALNGALISSGQFDELESLWLSLNEKNTLFPDFTLGAIQGILFERSLKSNQKLSSTIDTILNWQLMKNTVTTFLGVYSEVESGESKSFTNRNIDESHFKESLLASASIQPVYPATKVGSVWCGDGGYRNVIPVKELTELKGYNKIDKHFIIAAGILGNTKYNYKNGNIFTDFLRVVDILFDEVTQNDLKKGNEKYWNKDSKYVLIAPEIQMIETTESNNSKIRDNITYGYSIAKNIVG